jgi:hypothetical protein
MTSIDITHMHTFIDTSCRNDWKVSINKGQLKWYLVTTLDSLLVNGNSTKRETNEIQNPTGIGFEKFKMRKIYSVPPHIVADNHFSGDEGMDWLGRKGYGATMTYHEDHFPKGLKPYLHHDKVVAGCPKAKAMRFAMPKVAIKQQLAVEESKIYTKTLVSFQSTGATNICGVNNLPLVTNYVSKKVRGKGKTQRVWGIEQNKARDKKYKHPVYYVEILACTISSCKINGNHCSI